MSKKEKFPLYLSPEKKAILERRYQEDGSRSITAFIERAVDFYLDYLSANNAGLFLPTSIKSYLDGRMGQLEEDAARQRAAERLEELARESPQNALCAPLGEGAGVDTPSGVEGGFGPLSGAFPELPPESLPGVEENAGTKEKAG